MKNILILTDCHLPVPAVKGGAVPTLISSLLKQNETFKDFKIDIIVRYDKESVGKIPMYKNTNFILMKNRKPENIIDNTINNIVGFFFKSRKERKLDIFWKLRIINTAKKMLKKNNYYAVILENHGFLTKALKNKKLRDKFASKIFYHLHNEIPDSVDDCVINDCNMLLISNYLSKKIVKRYGEGVLSRTYRLKNCIVVPEFAKILYKEEREKIRHLFGFSETDKVVCFVGRISPDKGIYELLSAMQIIKDKNVKLLVVGATEFGNNVYSEFEEKIQNICSKIGDRVKITGFIPHSELWKYYQISDVAVLPSMWEEPAGLTILEALASGTAVITTNAGGIPEYISDEYAILLERGDNLSQQIADEIINIDTQSEKWIEKRRKAREYVINNFTEEIYYQNFSELINNINRSVKE